MKLSQKEGIELINLAKESIKSGFSGGDLEVNEEVSNKYSENRGVFVTLNLNSQLRGCIGFPEPVYPLCKAIVEAAKSAAFSDPRFSPLTESEFNQIEIEISVLSVPELISVTKYQYYLKNIKIGEHGLIIRSARGSGLLLPQVFTDYDCDSESALEMLCEKAGLDKYAWKDMSNKIYRFSAQIFHQ